MRAALLVMLLTACSVPELALEGKQCPCSTADGYVCDELTQRCLRTNDGGGIIDTPAATQCLASPVGETEVYRYAGTFDWQHEDASWTGNASEIHQSSNSAQGSYAYRTAANLTSVPDYRIIATMREISPGSGTPSLGIVLRAQLSPQDKSHYTCSWSRKDRQLVIEARNGGSSTVVGAASIGANVTIPASFTMEASVNGTALACCIREGGTVAKVTATDASVATGYPGLGTNRMEAGFASFVVFSQP